MTKLLDGKKTNKIIKKKLSVRIKKIKKKGIVPHMAIIRVGNDPASIVYLKNKKIACESIGIKYSEIIMSRNTKEEQLLAKINAINKDNGIHGLIVQFPLPNNISKRKIINQINPLKDVDGLHPDNFIKMYENIDGLKPCTPLGIITLLKHYKIKIESQNVVIIGRSKIVGMPLMKLFMTEDATVTMCFLKTKNLKQHTKNADIIVSAVGVAKLITADMVKQGVILIDVGISRVNGKIVGDIDFDNIKSKASWITPNPGGVGPMTVVSLLNNLVKIIDNGPNEI